MARSLDDMDLLFLFTSQHQYVERDTGQLCTERLCSDGFIQFLYSEPVRERRPGSFGSSPVTACHPSFLPC